MSSTEQATPAATPAAADETKQQTPATTPADQTDCAKGTCEQKDGACEAGKTCTKDSGAAKEAEAPKA